MSSMKKILKMVTAIVMVLSLAYGCGDTEGSNTGSAGDGSRVERMLVFTATITEVEDGTVLVTPEEGAEELKSSDSFRLAVKDMPASYDPQVGDVIEITYTGTISETYPAEVDDIKTVTVVKQKEAVENETEKTAGDSDYPACVMVDGIVYKDTGYIDSMIKCGNMDGEITSFVRGQLPSENNQSNFGTGYGYQRSVEGQVIVVIDDQWRIFRDIEIEDDSIPEQVKNFNAEVKEVKDDGTLLVSYVSMPEGFVSMSEGDYMVFADNLRGEVSKGDIVTIWFNGIVLETDPAQIGAYRIEKAEGQN